MADTNIEWADRVWNPVTGCTKVSAGCKFCYAEGIANRFWAKQYPHVDPSLRNENGAPRARRFTDVMTHDDRLLEPLRWRKPARIFVNSMSDLFHEDVPFKFIDRVFAVMALAPRHTFLVLTKRPARMREYLSAGQFRDARVADAAKTAHKEVRPFALPSEEIFNARYVARNERWQMRAWPLPNVHLGVSVENQETADERIPLLLQTPAGIRWVSYEPALGPVDFRPWLDGHEEAGTPFSDPPARTVGGCAKWTPPLDWIVVGGESGRGARPFHLDWARSVLEQCRAAGVACFIKQLGADPRWNTDWWKLDTMRSAKGGDPAEWPIDLRVRELPEDRQ